MKFVNLLLALSLSATVTHAAVTSSTTATHSTAVAHSTADPSGTGHGKDGSQGNKHSHGKGNHTHSALEVECREIHRLTELVDLGKNATKLDKLASKHHLNAAQVDKIKEKAANATVKLDKLKSNATLIKECDALQAKEELAHKCSQLHRLTELVDLTKNTTKLNELVSKHHLNATQVAKIKEKAANATTQLNKLESNATLVSECAKIKTEQEKEVNEGLATSTASGQAAQSTISRAAVGLTVGNGLLSVFVLTALAMLTLA